MESLKADLFKDKGVVADIEPIIRALDTFEFKMEPEMHAFLMRHMTEKKAHSFRVTMTYDVRKQLQELIAQIVRAGVYPDEKA